MTIDKATREKAHMIDEEGARRLRVAAMMVNNMPYAKMEPLGLEEVVFYPGERGVLALKWNGKKFTEVSTHPEAPAGLVVLPGSCEASEYMSVVVENESPLNIALTGRDFVAVGAQRMRCLRLRRAQGCMPCRIGSAKH
eukprot:5978497-Karenia_brevis.AAC.1